MGVSCAAIAPATLNRGTRASTSDGTTDFPSRSSTYDSAASDASRLRTRISFVRVRTTLLWYAKHIYYCRRIAVGFCDCFSLCCFDLHSKVTGQSPSYHFICHSACSRYHLLPLLCPAGWRDSIRTSSRFL